MEKAIDASLEKSEESLNALGAALGKFMDLLKGFADWINGVLRKLAGS